MPELWWDTVKSFINTSFFSNKKSRAQRYSVAIALIVIYWLIKSFLSLFLDTSASFHLQLIGVILSAWYGGLGPGLLSTLLLGIISGTIFHNSSSTIISSQNFISTGIFFLEGILLSIMSEARRQANEQKDEFIGFASHELKNPLATIKAYALLLKKQLRKTKQDELAIFASRIDDQTDKTTLLINELLDVTKIDTGKLQLNREKFRIADLLQEIIIDQKVISRTHKILLTGASRKKIYADRYRIGEVFINLLTNAIKYSPSAKKIEIFIKDKKKEVIVSIRDYGVGIDESNRKMIFDRFFREGTAENGAIQGLGLGLYISSQIIHRHDGNIWVESRKGKGSTFYISLPAAT